MAIDPEVIPSSSTSDRHSVLFVPGWVKYLSIVVTLIILFKIIKELFPVIAMVLLLAFIYRKVSK